MTVDRRDAGTPVTAVETDDRDGAIALAAYALEGVLQDLVDTGVDVLPRAQLAAIAAEPVSAAPLAPVTRPTPSTAPPAAKPVVEALARPLSIAASSAPSTAPASDPGDAARIASLVENRAIAPSERLRVLKDDIIGACTRCKLHRGRTKLVFGAGSPGAELVFVGEGPGADEDRQGAPFVGRAGELLTKMIEAMTFSRDEVYILNVVKCRPPNNRDPEPDEIAQCEPFLKAQLAILRPKVIVALGRHATQTLLATRAPISSLRGRWFQYEGVDLLPTFHPSYLLRSPDKKREAWADLQQVMRVFGRGRDT